MVFSYNINAPQTIQEFIFHTNIDWSDGKTPNNSNRYQMPTHNNLFLNYWRGTQFRRFAENDPIMISIIELRTDCEYITSNYECPWLWASYQIRKIAGCACAGNVGIVFPHPRFQRKPLVSDPDMHHGTCVTHVPWCMSGSLTCGDGENVPGIPGACAPAILRIWQEAHG